MLDIEIVYFKKFFIIFLNFLSETWSEADSHEEATDSESEECVEKLSESLL